jgi:sulfur carrier protein ThiS
VKVKVLLFGHHVRLLPSGSHGNVAVVEVEEGATVAELLDVLGVPPDGRRYVQLNRAQEEPAAILKDGDEVRVIVPLGGG